MSEFIERRKKAIAHVRRMVEMFVPPGQWARNAMFTLDQLAVEEAPCPHLDGRGHPIRGRCPDCGSTADL